MYTYSMESCCLSLLGETWFKIFLRRFSVKGKSELVVKCIESILRTGLQEEEQNNNELLFVAVVRVGLDSVSF